MRTIALIAAFALTLTHLPARENSREVTGYVKSADGEALPYANIVIKNTTTGCTSGLDGKFSLQLPRAGTYTLVVHYTGFEPVEKPITLRSDTTVNFDLKEDALKLSEVTVTGTRTPKLLKDAPTITRVITSDDIRRINAVTVKDVLELELPGIEFTRQMDKKTQSINMQGMSGNYVLFLVDGERMAGETLNNVDYNRLNVNNIERIEIVKGSASALYGSNAVGGVVNIITKDVQQPLEAYVNGKWGSHNEQQYDASVGARSKRFSSHTSYTYKRMDTYDITGSDGSTTIYGGEDHSVNEKLTWQPVDALTFTAKGGFYTRNADTDEKVADRYRDFNASLRTNYRVRDNHTLEATYLFDRYNKYDWFKKLGDRTELTYRNTQHTARVQYNGTFAPGNILTAGAELFRDELLSYQFTDGTVYGNTTYVAFAQHDYNITDRLNVVYGVRMDYHSDFGSHFSPKASVMYKLSPVTLRASYSHGFRSPSLKELHTSWDMGGMGFLWIQGNPNLKPEKNNHVSLSAEYTRDRVNFSVTGYYNQIKDKISSLTLPRSRPEVQDTSLYVNIDKAKVSGIDANLAVKCPYGFTLRTAYSYVRDRQMQDGRNLSSTRPHTATFGLSYDYAARSKKYELNVTLTGRILSRVNTWQTSSSSADGYEPLNYPAYTLWRLAVTQHLFGAYSLNAGVDNLFNYKPDKVTAANTPITSGTTFFVGVSAYIDRIFTRK